MEENFGKYLRLFGTLFFIFIGSIAGLILLMFALKFFFGLLSYIPWFTYFYMSLIVMVPAAIFVTAYLIFFRRTRYHPSKAIRIFSRSVFMLALAAWAYFFIADLLLFFRHFYTTIEEYHTYNLLFLALNIACIFFVGILQALTSTKEVDWMERNRAK